MRVSVINILLITGCGMLAHAHEGNGQSLDQRVTIGMNNESLEVLFHKLERQTGFSFVFDSRVQVMVNFPVAERSVKEVLELALENSGFTYQVVRKSIAIVPEVETAQTVTSTSLNSQNIFLRLFTVTGNIVDNSNNEPIAGANILVKGTTRGISSDAAGKYSIEAETGETLVFSFIGFKTIERVIDKQTAIDVSMKLDVTSLNEVEIIGTNYFSTTKERSTMNIAKVSGKEIEAQPVTSLLNAVVGRVAGLDITPTNGAPGRSLTVQIRGNNSLSYNGSNPLYVIDGVQIDSRPVQSASNSLYASGGFDPLMNINPASIESIEVLKDAAATAIYGSRGANGVIRITTKQAQSRTGKTNIDLNVYTGVGQLGNRVNLLNNKQYLEMRHEAFRNINTIPSEFAAPDLTGIWDSTRFTDWQEVLLGGSAQITDLQGGFSWGNPSTAFRIGGGYHKEGTIYPGEFGFKKATTDFSLNHTSNDRKFNAFLSLNFGWSKNKAFDNLNFVNQALSLSPIAPKLYNDDGTLNWQTYPFFGGSFVFHTFSNPLSYLLNTHDNISKSIISSGSISYQILYSLKAKVAVTLSDISNNEEIKNPIESNAPYFRRTSTGSASFNGNSRTSLMIEPQLDYQKDFGNHHVSALMGAAWQQRRSAYKVVQGSNYPSDAFLGTIRGAKTVQTVIDENSQYRYAAVYARLAYDFNNKYLIDLAGRRDGSSRFGPGKKYGNFGAISAGWIFTQEKLIKDNLLFLSFGKIRGSYGITGNDQIGDYQYLKTYNILTYGYDDGVSIVPASLYNPDFAWEVTKKFELGLELGLFNNRIAIEVAQYKNRSSNQLVQYPLAATTGFQSVLANFEATIENSGYEFVLSTKNILRENFQWHTTFNVTAPRNKLIKFKGIESSPYAAQYKVGEPLSIQWLYKYKGINPETGLYEVVDINNDNNLDSEDRQFTSPLGRTSYGGITNTMQYKNFDLSFLFQLSNNVIQGVLPINYPGNATNQPVEVIDRWRGEGDVPKFGKFIGNSSYVSYYDNYVQQSDKNIADASFIRLKTISFGYQLPTELRQRAQIKNARLYVQGQNIFTLTKYKGLDPETGFALPPLRMITAGLQFTL